MTSPRFYQLALGIIAGVLLTAGPSAAVPITHANIINNDAAPDDKEQNLDGSPASAQSIGAGYAGRAHAEIGLNRAFSSRQSTELISETLAVSMWSVGFTLSHDANLILNYAWDVTLSETAPPTSQPPHYGSSASFIYYLANPFNPVYYVGLTAQNNPIGASECNETRGANTTGNINFCDGYHAASGALTWNFRAGFQHRIEGYMETRTSGLAATSDAFQSGKVLSIIVPDGVTWTYEAGVTGNPLNLQYEAAAVPEPGSMSLLGFGAAGLAFRIWRKRRLS